MSISSHEGFHGSCTGHPRPEAPARSLEQPHGHGDTMQTVAGHATWSGDRTVQLPPSRGHVCSPEMWLQDRRCQGKVELVPGTVGEPVLGMVFGDQTLSWSSFSSPSGPPGQTSAPGRGGITSLAIASGYQELRQMPDCKEAARLRSLHLRRAHSGGVLRDERL